MTPANAVVVEDEEEGSSEVHEGEEVGQAGEIMEENGQEQRKGDEDEEDEGDEDEGRDKDEYAGSFVDDDEDAASEDHKKDDDYEPLANDEDDDESADDKAEDTKTPARYGASLPSASSHPPPGFETSPSCIPIVRASFAGFFGSETFSVFCSWTSRLSKSSSPFTKGLNNTVMFTSLSGSLSKALFASAHGHLCRFMSRGSSSSLTRV